MEQLAGNQELRARMGRAGLDRVREEFSVEAQVEGTLNVYRSLLQSGSSRD
jgi:glycosyltransferase involved in cell wall biosynthesis